MIITGMAHFESVCKRKLVEWYRKNKACVEIDLSNVYEDVYGKLTNTCHTEE